MKKIATIALAACLSLAGCEKKAEPTTPEAAPTPTTGESHVTSGSATTTEAPATPSEGSTETTP